MKLLSVLMAATAAVSLGALATYAQAPTPEPVPTCPPAAAGFINGRVSEKFVDPSGLIVHPSPLSVSGATVELQEYGLTTTTDANGCFAFEVPPSDRPVTLFTVRASAPEFGSLTLANLPGYGGDGIGLDVQLERGAPSRLVDYCHFEVTPESAARRAQYEECAEEGRLTGPAAGPSPAAPPVTGRGSVASDSQVIPVWLSALLAAAAITGLAAAAWSMAPRRAR